MSKEILEQTNCPFCPSTDAFTIYDEDGKVTGWCYSCETFSHNPYEESGGVKDTLSAGVRSSKGSNTTSLPSTALSSVAEGLAHPVRSIPDRNITHSSCEHYNVRVGVSPTDGITPLYHLYPCVKDGITSGFQQRIVDPKSFVSIGDTKDAPLFGHDVIPQKGKKLWITEGALDALSCYQVLSESSPNVNWSPAVVSLPNGTSSAVRSITSSAELLEGYEEIILVFDMDAPGQAARKEICKILAGKVYTLDLPFKDANEMLMAGKSDDLKWALLTKLKKYQPDGIVNAKDLWERYKDESTVPSFPYPPSLPILNQKTYGVRPGSLVTVTAGTGSGKSQFLRELMHHYYHTTTEKIAGMFLEEDVSDTLSGLLSIQLNKRINLPDVEVTEDEESGAFEAMFGSGRISLYDYFGGMDDANLLGKLRFFAATGHKFIFLDHLSIVVSEYAAQGGERERIDTLMTKLAKFVKETGTILFLVVHLRKSSEGTSFEEGAPPTLDDLRGSGTLKQLSWDVIGLSRPQQHPDPVCANTTEVTSLKCRFTGNLGIADYLYYDQFTGRMINTEKPANYRPGRRKNKTSLSTEY